MMKFYVNLGYLNEAEIFTNIFWIITVSSKWYISMKNGQILILRPVLKISF